ncbi:hypothetical protein DSO57_1030506 [Entomophthora muscae]|uniref:Uncharacterized protein n=1 Tax=Entomophthora muscae TaxID=34485 RepID=A0ACC2TBS4_9FUNG|nr:hypothetical protein DSO57_1030506 [Entomophthora muscae]
MYILLKLAVEVDGINRNISKRYLLYSSVVLDMLQASVCDPTCLKPIAALAFQADPTEQLTISRLPNLLVEDSHEQILWGSRTPAAQAPAHRSETAS